jgi:hypothetical protein
MENGADNSCRSVNVEFGKVFPGVGVGRGKEKSQRPVQEAFVGGMEKLSKRRDSRSGRRRICEPVKNLLERSGGY